MESRQHFTDLLPRPRPVREAGIVKGLCSTLVHKTLGTVMRIPEIDRLYADLPATPDSLAFTEVALSGLKVSLRLSQEDFRRIPASGPVVVVSNHPFGAVEGLLLANVLRRRRPDAKLLANYLLGHVPELRDMLVLVDPFGGTGAAGRNLGPLRESLKWLKSGGLLGVFPAGEVSHYRPGRGVADPDWSPLVARLARMSGCPVLPIYFHGANGPLFQLMGIIHPRLRTVMLPREMLNKGGQTIEMRIGSPIPPAKFAEYPSDEDLITFLRLRTYNLKHAALRRDRERQYRDRQEGQAANQVPVIGPAEPGDLERELAALPEDRAVARAGSLQAIWFRAAEAPTVLREIGRLREIAFRQVGEGTGEEIDLDPFDESYVHLALWNAEAREVVGAYRLGLTDEIRPRFGKKGMYTCTLFKYKKAFLSAIEPSIELGRSFVRPEYQRHSQALPLLWKGLARFVARHPKYRHLFGPVSITDRYEPASRQYMLEFLRRNNLHDGLARHVRAKTPPKFQALRKTLAGESLDLVKGVEGLDALVADIESEGRGLPVLLKQYLKFGGELLGFNVDQGFGNCLDGLILVDLLRTDRKILARYMGREEMAGYLAYHGQLL